MTNPAANLSPRLAFVGGGNMASAILGGLIQAGHPVSRLFIVEPFAPQAALLRERFGVEVADAADARLAASDLVVWAVKPQSFQDAAAPCQPHLGRQTLHLSVMAGIRSDAIAEATGSDRVVRSMPNTPALIGQGIAGLYARAAVTEDNRRLVETVLAPTGQTLWVDQEADLDAVTALSGSGPAYVFLFIEAMVEAAGRMGLSPAQGRALALATFRGATALATQSEDPPSVLRERVTSKGGTTAAALGVMAAREVPQALIDAMQAARDRARELGDEFGRR